MFKNKQFRSYFKVLKNQVNGYPLIYFDNGATTLKPDIVIEAINDYYYNFPANVHRSDFVYGYKATKFFEASRAKIASFFNCELDEVIFTSGSTQSSNVVSSSFATILKKGDEIIVNEAEHASNILGWFEVAKKTQAKIIFAPLEKNKTLNFASIKSKINKRTKIIVFSLTTNVIGDTRDFKQICQLSQENQIITVVDAAQCLYLHDFNFKKIAADFLFFSGHKIFGPTGIGVLLAKKSSQKYLKVSNWGGGMNDKFNSEGRVKIKSSPYCYEAGTPNIAGAIGLQAAFSFITKWSFLEMKNYLYDLKNYAVKKLSENDQIIIHNEEIVGSIIIFEYKGVFSQDVASYLSSKGIAVRCGDHCSKLLNLNTIRISLAPYNNKSEIDFLVKVLENKTLEDFIDIFAAKKEDE